MDLRAGRHGSTSVLAVTRHADPRTLMRSDHNRADIAGAMARAVSELL